MLSERELGELAMRNSRSVTKDANRGRHQGTDAREEETPSTPEKPSAEPPFYSQMTRMRAAVTSATPTVAST